MADVPPDDPRLAQPRGGCWFFVLPIAMVAVIVLGYASLCVAGYQGRPADGDVVRMDYDACAEALPILEARVAEMGLGDPVFADRDGGASLTARLPREHERAAQIPVALTLPGAFAILDDDGETIIDNSHISDSLVRLDITANPSTIVLLNDTGAKTLKDHMRGHKDGVISVRIDGVEVYTHLNIRPLEEGKLDIPTTQTTLEGGTAECAERALLLNNGVLPCEVSLVGTTVVDKAPEIEP